MTTNTEAPARNVKPSPVKAGKVNWTNNARALWALAEFRALKIVEAAGKRAESRRKSVVEPILAEELRGAEVAVVRGIDALKVQHSSNGRVDAALLAEAFPEAHAATFVSTPYSFYKVL